MPTLPNFSLKIALLRKGITQRDLAFEMRIDESRISRIIRGYEVPTDEIKQSISQHLGVDEGELFLN
jgi:transcriptional regulator with XRE-family HTH domain